MTDNNRKTIELLDNAIDLVDKIMIAEYIGINYEGWLAIYTSAIDTDQIIDMACKVHDYTAGDIAAQILADMANLNKEYVSIWDAHKATTTDEAEGESNPLLEVGDKVWSKATQEIVHITAVIPPHPFTRYEYETPSGERVISLEDGFTVPMAQSEGEAQS